MRVSQWLDKHGEWAPVILRMGVGLVFLWFGIDKFIHVSNWIGWVPQWMESVIPMSLTTFMYVQGVIESVIGVLLLIGYQVRIASGVAVITLLGVEIAMIGTGQTEMMLRDGAILAVAISLLFTGSKKLSVDGLLSRKE